MADLTLEQIDRIIANHDNGVQLTGVGIYRQLAAVTRERDALADILQRLVEAKAEKNVNGDTALYRHLKAGLWESARDTLARLASGDLREPTA